MVDLQQHSHKREDRIDPIAALRSLPASTPIAEAR